MTDIEQRAHDLALEAASKLYDLSLQIQLTEVSKASKEVDMCFLNSNIGILCDYYIRCYNSFKAELEAKM